MTTDYAAAPVSTQIAIIIDLNTTYYYTGKNLHAAILIKNQLKRNVGKRHSKTVPVHLKGVEIKIDNCHRMSFYDKITKNVHPLESESTYIIRIKKI